MWYVKHKIKAVYVKNFMKGCLQMIPGNHENYDALRKYPQEEWQGGNVRRIRPSVILLEQGQIFSLAGKRFFTMGGASSHDIQDGILEPDDSHFRRKKRA
ncbi:MAG: hypothetical protein HFF20_04480 [Oscillospiraceae bacterium]|nr:hypothetical protein [Oscillospiraceae bacterium]